MADDAKAAAQAALEAKSDAGWDNFGAVAAEASPEPTEPSTPTQAQPAEPAPTEVKTGQEGEAEPPSTAQTPVPSPRQSDYEYLISRYKRDGMSDEQAREVAARDALDHSNRLAEANRRLQERERELEELRANATPKDQEEPRLEIPEEVAQIKQRLDADRLEFETAQTEVKALRPKADVLREEIADLDEQIRDPGPNTDVGQLEYDRKRKVAKYEGVVRQIREVAARGNAAGQRYDATVPIHNQAVRLHQIEREAVARREAEVSAREATIDQQTKSTFYSVAKEVAEDPSIGMPEALREKFFRPHSKNSRGGEAYRAAMAFLVPDENGVTPSISDFKAFLTQAAKDYLADTKDSHERQSAVYAGKKLEDAGQGPGNKTGQAPTEERRKPSAEALEELTDSRWEKSRISAFV